MVVLATNNSVASRLFFPTRTAHRQGVDLRANDEPEGDLNTQNA